MKTQHVFSASAAAVLAVSLAAFAQTPQTARPSTQTPSTEAATPSTQSPSPSSSSSPSDQSASPSTQAEKQPASQASQANRQSETPVTLVGCVMRETDYRKANDKGRGGPLATGIGRGDEFVLVNAMKTTAGAATSAASAECGTSATGEAYELGGSREKDLASYVGRRVEITGTLKEAKTTTGATGEAKPTGGFDPLKQDLKVFEVDVASFRPVPAGQSAAASAPAAQATSAPDRPAAQPAPRPAEPAPPAAAPAPPESQPTAASPRQRLPRTASPVPLTGLLGLLSFATGLALRRRG